MEVTVELVRTLREQTGAGIMDCKQALQDNAGNLDKAAEDLRKKGFAQAAKRVGRATNQGIVESYIHTGGRVGALVELGCETDFVARTPEFKELAHDLAMQVAAMSPSYIDESEVKDGESVTSQMILLKQPFIKDGSRSVGEMVQELAAKVGENVRIVRFSRLALGE